MKANQTLFAMLFLSLSGCFLLNDDPYEFDSATLPSNPQNLTEFNSPYDDYNSTSPTLGGGFPLVFSSNRATRGGNFDFVMKMMAVNFSKRTGELRIDEETYWGLDAVISNENIVEGIGVAKTEGNELGPSLTYIDKLQGGSNINGRYNAYLLLYASDFEGDLDIMYTQNYDSVYYSKPAQVPFLNSEFDDAYPSFSFEQSKIYFTSNRSGNFDIYTAQLGPTCGYESCGEDFLRLIQNTATVDIEMNSELSSDANDKCPFVIGDMLVFTSDRAGGFGGFDLYFSRYESGIWSEPINLGEEVNSEYDEYRPIIKKFPGFTNDMLIFSSNRPGGQGGFDLYYAGVELTTLPL